MASITRIDSPVTLRERIDRGDVVVNYGLQVVYRNQGDVVMPANTVTAMTTTGTPTGPQPQTPEQVGPSCCRSAPGR